MGLNFFSHRLQRIGSAFGALVVLTFIANVATADSIDERAVRPKELLDPQLWLFASPYQPWQNPPPVPPDWWAKRADSWAMFVAGGETQWRKVAEHVSVIAINRNSVENGCLENRTSHSPKNCTDRGIDNERSLDQYFRSLREHGIHSALEIGLLVDTQLTSPAITAACGQEAFSTEPALRLVLQKIQDAGAVLDYLRMDEPFTYGTMSCKESPANIAAALNLTIKNIVRPYFPDIRVGDVEVTSSLPGDPVRLAQWTDQFTAATGRSLAFFHADATWSTDLVFKNFARISMLMHDRGISFGVIWNANNQDTDLGWTRSAINHFTQAESARGIDVDQPIFQSWTAKPTYAVPEQSEGTLLNVAYQYLLPKTHLRLATTSGRATATLVDAEHEPVSAATITAEAIDIANQWNMTLRNMTGTVPLNAAFAVIGIRANTEGAVMAEPTGEADLGLITLHYVDASSVSRTWQSRYATPDRILITPSTKLVANLSNLDSINCNGNPAVSVTPGSPYSLDVPMSASLSADHAGYVTLVFVDGNCRGLSRTSLFFIPSSRQLDADTSATNLEGRMTFAIPRSVSSAPYQLHAYYGGNNSTRRPSMAILDVPQEGHISP